MRFSLSCLFLILLFASCTSDQEPGVEAATATLEGRWELTEARRDNVKTLLLDGLYFVFGPSSAFETNLLTGTAQSGTYTRDGSELTTEGVAVPLTYEITQLEDGELVLRSRYEGFVFDFLLRRAGGGAPEVSAED